MKVTIKDNMVSLMPTSKTGWITKSTDNVLFQQFFREVVHKCLNDTPDELISSHEYYEVPDVYKKTIEKVQDYIIDRINKL